MPASGIYPLPRKQLLKIAAECDALLVIEDGQPFVEKQLKGYLGNALRVKGRMDGTLPPDGELNPDIVAKALGFENKSTFSTPPIVEMRPPALCEGCGHRDMYTILTKVLREEFLSMPSILAWTWALPSRWPKARPMPASTRP